MSHCQDWPRGAFGAEPAVRHAGPHALEALADLLKSVRLLPGLAEKKPGIFYTRGKAFLHFHEDAAGFFADARIDGQDFARYPVNTQAEKASLLRALRSVLGS